MYMHDLERELLETLEADRDLILASDYPEDELHMPVDNLLTTNERTLVQYLANDHSLAEPDDIGLAGDDPTTIWRMIIAAMYERLSNAAYQWLYAAQEEESEKA